MCVEVRDRGHGFGGSGRDPVPRLYGGRGLLIVAALSTRWGHDGDDGVRVWSEIAPH